MNRSTPLFLSALLMLSAACEQHHTLTPLTPLPHEPVDCTINKSASFVRPVDLLFVVDNSGSMREEQDALRAQIPRLLHAFASGDLNDDGVPEHPAVTDLHVGVISTDMGLPDVPNRLALGCGDETRRFGDNGALLLRPNPAFTSCSAPSLDQPFVTWQRSDSGTDTDAGDTVLGLAANDVACLSTLGTNGCGFEQHLESALKALWPSNSMINDTAVSLDRPFFDNTQGQGAPLGANAGFLRNDPGAESVVIVVLLTDENDCSSHTMTHFTPSEFLTADDRFNSVGLNVRCMNAQENLFAVRRYVDGLKALRPGHEDLVLFTVVAGVPTDLIDRTVDLTDASALNAYYDTMLADPRMQEVEDTDPEVVLSNPNVRPSCKRPVPFTLGEPEFQKAYPPRRIVEVARQFGRNGLVESICQDDYTEVVDQVLKRAFDTLERTSCINE